MFKHASNISEKSNLYKDKYVYFLSRYSKFPKKTKRIDIEWHDFISHFLSSQFIQSLLKNNKPICTLKKYIDKKFNWEYSKFYSATIRRLKNPYVSSEVINYTSYNITKLTLDKIQIEDILKTLLKLCTNPDILSKDLKNNKLYNDKLLTYLKNNHCKSDSKELKVNKNYKKTIKNIFVNNEDAVKLRKYKNIIFCILKRIASSDEKDYKYLSKIYFKSNFSTVLKESLNRHSVYTNRKKNIIGEKPFKYDNEEKEWIYKEKDFIYEE